MKNKIWIERLFEIASDEYKKVEGLELALQELAKYSYRVLIRILKGGN